MAATGRFNGTSQEEIAKIWNFKIQEAERKMSMDWLESSSVPLANSVWDLEVQKLRLIDRVSEMSWDGLASIDYCPRSGSSQEVWIETVDHSVGGFIDSVVESGQEIILRDYKSGLICEPDSEPSTIKPEYVAQLEIYCGVFFEVRGQWPTALEIVPIVGEPVRIQVDKARCLAIVQSAREMLYAINRRIESSVNGRETALNLGSPSAANCARCEYRPNCAAYKSKASSIIEDGGPVDVLGLVVETASFPNGSSAITVKTNSGNKRVRGLDSRLARHPALARLKEGSSIGIYSLRAIREKKELAEGPGTTIYDESLPSVLP